MITFCLATLWGLCAAALTWPRPSRLPTPIRSGPGYGQSGAHSQGQNRSGRGRIGVGVAVGVGLLAVAPLLAPWPVLAIAAWGRLAEARRLRQQRDEIIDQLPDLVDLLRLTTAAGLPLSSALLAIDDRPGGSVGRAIASAAGLVRRGASNADALAALSEACGPPIRGVVDVLSDHDRYGTTLEPALERVAVECRLQRRRLAEEAARRLPVTLLFPLVLTTLPAFVALTIVPLLMGSFSSLRL